MHQKHLGRSDNTRYVHESSRGPAGSASHTIKAGIEFILAIKNLTCKHLDRSSASGLTQLSLGDAYMYYRMRAHFRVNSQSLT